VEYASAVSDPGEKRNWKIDQEAEEYRHPRLASLKVLGAIAPLIICVLIVIISLGPVVFLISTWAVIALAFLVYLKVIPLPQIARKLFLVVSEAQTIHQSEVISWRRLLTVLVVCPFVAVVVTNALYYVTGMSFPWWNVVNDILPDLPWFYAMCTVLMLPATLLFERHRNAQQMRDSPAWSLVLGVYTWTITTVGFYQMAFLNRTYSGTLKSPEGSIVLVFGTIGGGAAGITYWLLARRPWRTESPEGT
jgi:hypothetical protein